MATQNRGVLESHRLHKSLFSKPTKSTDLFITEHLKNGKTRKKELQYGTSFYSQSSRNILISKQVNYSEVTDYQGHKRKF